MPTDDLRDRIAAQFADRADRRDVWRAFDLLLDTDRYLDLGHSPRGWPTLLGSSQRRLVDVVGDALAGHLRETEGARVLDVGCGRGGPAVRLAERHGVRPLGLDLVPDNVARARANARGVDASFVVGDATAIPVRDDSMSGATSVDALVYLPDLDAVLREVGRVLATGAPLVASDLVLRPSPTAAERTAADAFAEAWDMPPLRTADRHRRALAEAGFDVRAIRDLTPHSVGRFRRYTTPFLWTVDGPLGGFARGAMRRGGLDPALVTHQVRAAHRALPALRHVLVVGEQGQAPGAPIPT